MAYQIIYASECLSEAKNLDFSVLKKLKTTIENRLAVSPEVYGKPLRYSKKGLWSLRKGDYRVIYKIVGNEVWIIRVGHRKEVYK